MTPSKTPKYGKNSESEDEQIQLNFKPDEMLQIPIKTGKLKDGKIPATIHVVQFKKNTHRKVDKLLAGFYSLANHVSQYKIAAWLFVFAVSIYLVTRLIGLTQFPIYFFTDEAVQTQSIIDLISHGYRDNHGVLFPPYFRNGDYYNLGLSVYLQWIPFLVFGKSAFVTRATSVIITLIAAMSAGFILRDVFNAKYWWLGTLLLSITPAWFYHSRTAFETAEFTAFFAGTLCAYLFYRYKSPRYIYLTFLLAAFAFYTYSPGQFIVPVTVIALFVSDWRYHWENKKTTWMGLFLLAILSVPYFRYRMEYPDAAFSHLYALGSYIVENIPLSEKVRRYFSEYSIGLSSWYWYIPNNRDLSRHIMKGYGHIMVATLPFAVLGLARMLSHLRESANRTILIALLVTPVSAALVETGITRVLAFVFPAALLTALGLEQVLGWLENPVKAIAELRNTSKPEMRQLLISFLILVGGVIATILIKDQVDRLVVIALTIIMGLQISKSFERLANWSRLPRAIKEWKGWVIPQTILALVVFTVLSFLNFFMLNDSLQNGPLWFRDYGMGGMQYGGFQVFEIIKQYKEEHTDTRIIFSPNWANGTNVLAGFFLDDPMSIEIANIEGYIAQKLPLDESTVFIMVPDEYNLATSNSKFTDIRVEKIIPYPDGTPGFYFVRLRYADNVDEIFAAEKALRDVLRKATVTIDGQVVNIEHTYLDAGNQEEAQQAAIEKVFDNDPFSLAKTFEANPFIIKMTFPLSRFLNGFSIVIGSAKAQITLKCYSTIDGQPVIYTFNGQGTIDQPELSFDLPNPVEIRVLQVEMLDPLSSPPTKVHIWELKLR